MDGSSSEVSEHFLSLRVGVRVSRINGSDSKPFSVLNQKTVLLNDFRKFSFNWVEDSTESSQSSLYEHLFRPSVRSCIKQGNNSTFVAYGAQGTGKTYSLIGDIEERGNPNDRGAIPRCFDSVFDYAHSRSAQKSGGVAVFVSFLQISNEVITDLLKAKNTNLRIIEGASSPERLSSLPDRAHESNDDFEKTLKRYSSVFAKDVPRLRTYQLPSQAVDASEAEKVEHGKGTHVMSLTEKQITSAKEGVAALRRGLMMHSLLNGGRAESISKCHTVFTIFLYPSAAVSSNGQPYGPSRRINFVKLAGSDKAHERGDKAVSSTKKQIVKTVALTFNAFTNVIQFLNRSGTVPYRHSRLTHLLKDSLCPGASVVLLACVSSSGVAEEYEETLSTLKFARRILMAGYTPMPRAFSPEYPPSPFSTEASRRSTSKALPDENADDIEPRSSSPPPPAPEEQDGLLAAFNSSGLRSTYNSSAPTSPQRLVSPKRHKPASPGAWGGMDNGDMQGLSTQYKESPRRSIDGFTRDEALSPSVHSLKPLEEEQQDESPHVSTGGEAENGWDTNAENDSDRIEFLERKLHAYKIALRKAKDEKESTQRELMSRIVAAVKVTSELRAEMEQKDVASQRLRREIGETRSKTMREAELRQAAEVETERWQAEYQRALLERNTLEGSARALTAQLKRELRKSREMLQSEVDDAEHREEMRIRETGAVQMDLRDALKTANELADSLRKSENEKGDLEVEVRRLSDEVSLCQREVDARDKQLQTLQDDLTASHSQYDEVAAELSELRAQLQSANVDREELTVEIEKLRQQHRLSLERQEGLRQQVEESEAEVNKSQDEVARLKKDLEDSIAQLNNAAKIQHEAADKHEGELHSLRQEMAHLRVRNNTLVDEWRAAEIASKDSQRQLESIVYAKEEQLRYVERDASSLKAALHLLDDELSQYRVREQQTELKLGDMEDACSRLQQGVVFLVKRVSSASRALLLAKVLHAWAAAARERRWKEVALQRYFARCEMRLKRAAFERLRKAGRTSQFLQLYAIPKQLADQDQEEKDLTLARQSVTRREYLRIIKDTMDSIRPLNTS
mmetsp:Transcript_23927/g.39332  ORF Transcript_23927/g.39332 Transcript_23927/m.39332 type:complete len:1082 (-) Transcript_23927:883-4128(-)